MCAGALSLGAGTAVAASGWTAYALAYAGSSSDLTPFNTASRVAGTVIPASSTASQVVFAPNGLTAYVSNNSGSVTPVDVSTGQAGSPISVPGSDLDGLAIAPDGRTLYVISYSDGDLIPVDLRTGEAETPIHVGSYPDAVAVAPNGQTAYVANCASSGTVVPVDLTNDTVETAIPAGGCPEGIVITPNGQTAYTVDNYGNQVTPIDLSDDEALPAISIPTGTPENIAMAPDGQTAYVVDYGGYVTPIDTGDNETESTIDVGTPLGDIAITPDSGTAFVTPFDDGDVVPIDLVTDTVGQALDVNGSLGSVAIAPDQAPVAAFAAVPGAPGEVTTFSGARSSSQVGSIASYAWSFGDGSSPVTTTAPATSHVYAKPGTYSVRLTVTDTAGTSLSQVFTGQTMSLNGGPSATVTHTVTVFAAPVLSGVKQSHRRWREGNVKHLHGKRPPKGTTFSFRLSEAASVSLRFSGPKLHGHAQSATLRKLGHAGANRIAFDGRIPGHVVLGPGRWHVTLQASTTGGTSKTAKLTFTIVG